jgi:predicted DNA-binding transcriptional regulator AlpA
MPDTLLTEKQVAALLGLTGSALRKWRQQRRGPQFIRLSPRAVRYDPAAISKFLAARQVDPALGGERKR